MLFQSEKKLAEGKEKIKKLETEIDTMKKSIREKELESNTKIEKLTTEVRDWMYKNSKLAAHAEYSEEKNKVLESNLKVTLSANLS